MQAVGAAVGRWLFEYLVLLVTLYGIGARPDIWLVLMAFVAASLLGMIPFTPGGLGFVEAGLAGTLALSGITTAEALLATLVFRLVSFWLPMPVGVVTLVRVPAPLPAGARHRVGRGRRGRRRGQSRLSAPRTTWSGSNGASPVTSTTTLCSVPVNGNGPRYRRETAAEPASSPQVSPASVAENRIGV